MPSAISTVLAISLSCFAIVAQAQSLLSIEDSDEMPTDLVLVRCAGYFAALRDVGSIINEPLSNEAELAAELSEAEETLTIGAIVIAQDIRGWTSEKAAAESVGMKENFKKFYYDTLIIDAGGAEEKLLPNETWTSDDAACRTILNSLLLATDSSQ